MKSIAPFSPSSSSSLMFASSTPLDTKVFVSTNLNRKQPQFNLKLTTIHCKTRQNEATQSNKSENSTNHKMEDYNTAMKRMMRNPYEYHHDLGLYFSTSSIFLKIIDSCNVMIFGYHSNLLLILICLSLFNLIDVFDKQK